MPSYPVSYPSYSHGLFRQNQQAGHTVVHESKPWTQCWAKHADDLCSGREDCAACCLEVGDFEATAGLCPYHYGEIVG